jgi:hypothetical protein
VPLVTRPATIALLIVAGCAHAAPPPEAVAPAVPSNPRPGWVDHLPSQDGFVYAVGVSGPTFYPDDGLRYAAEKGRAQLAFDIASHVTAASLSVETTGGGTMADSASVVDATHDYTDAIVRFSEVLSTWVDKIGDYSGVPGTTYALVRIKKSAATPGSLPPVPAPAPASP